MDEKWDQIVNTRRPMAIALGGGGARGIGHVLAPESLDEMGICPVAIAGAYGAITGGAYAEGIEGRAIRTRITRRPAQSLRRRQQFAAGAGGPVC